MKLQEILEELIMRSAFEKGMNKDYITQAKSAIEEMFGEWVGIDEEILDPCPAGEINRMLDAKIRNQAKQEIRNRVKEYVK